MNELVTGRNNHPNFRINGQFLYSQYNPQREARRFLESGQGQLNPGIFLIFGDPLLYLCQPLLEADTRNLCFACGPLETSGILELVPDESQRKRLFYQPFTKTELWIEQLEQHLAPEFLSLVQILSWPRGMELMDQFYSPLLDASALWFRRTQGTLLTRENHGSRWLHNTLVNLKRYQSGDPQSAFVIQPPTQEDSIGTYPLVLAASGPSLEESRTFLQNNRNAYVLWALPSSLEALHSWGLCPDVIVSTDGGYYAKHHFRNLALWDKPGPRILCPLEAQWPDDTGQLGVFLQNTELEMILALEKEMPQGVARVTAAGTVAYSALGLALGATWGEIIVLGLDFNQRDLFSHVRPHGFDTLWEAGTARLEPLVNLLCRKVWYSQNLILEDGSRSSQALQTYSRLLPTWVQQNRQRIKRYQGSGTSLAGFESISQEGLEKRLTQHPSLPLNADFPRMESAGATRDGDWIDRSWQRWIAERGT